MHTYDKCERRSLNGVTNQQMLVLFVYKNILKWGRCILRDGKTPAFL